MTKHSSFLPSRAYVALAATAVLVLGLTAGALFRRVVVPSAPPINAEAGRAECDSLLSSFVEYPLLYLGESFQGHELSRCFQTKTPAKYLKSGELLHPGTDYVTFIYGRCSIAAGQQSCTPPVQVFSDPPCGPKLFEGAHQDGEVLRGAVLLEKADGSIRIETPGYSVTIYAVATPDSPGDASAMRANARNAINGLRGANDLAKNLLTSTTLDGSNVDAGSYCK